MAAAPGEDEASIDAKIKETEASIADLQKRRAELLRAKGAIRWAKTKGSTPGVRAPEPVEAAAALPVTVSKTLEKALGSMEWSSFKKKEGEWSFLRNRDGSLVDALVAETEFVNHLRKGKEIVVGKYRYAVSEDKFLNRHFQA